MPRTFAHIPACIYRDRSKNAHLYERVDAVPDGMKWKPSGVRAVNVTVLLSTPGEFYKLIRDLDTGEVLYFKRKDEGPAATPKEKTDEEPKRKEQARYRVGALCWFVDAGAKWYLVEVVSRTGENRETHGEAKRIAIRSHTGWDADKQTPWPYGELLEFPAYPNNQLFRRLRPLRDRYR